MALALHQNYFLLQAHVIKFSTAVTTNQQKAKFYRQKKVRWCRAMQFQHFPRENVIFKNARISIPTTQLASVREIPKSEANLPSDEKVGFSRNLENGLRKCQLPRPLIIAVPSDEGAVPQSTHDAAVPPMMLMCHPAQPKLRYHRTSMQSFCATMHRWICCCSAN